MWKSLNKTVKILVIAGIAVVVVVFVGLIGSLILQVDAIQAREAALAVTGGGEVISQEMDTEGLWNEYSFDIVNGTTWYEVEINAFGDVTGMESNQGGYDNFRDWD